MRLTDNEWQVLGVLWAAKDGVTLGQAVEALRPATGWSRNTVLTYLTRMAAKGLVSIDKAAAPHRYRAAAERRDCAAQERRSLVERVYEGSAGKFIAAFLREEPLSHQERDELRRPGGSMGYGAFWPCASCCPPVCWGAPCSPGGEWPWRPPRPPWREA